MTFRVPFQKPQLAEFESYLPYVKAMEASHFYSNYGPLNSRLEERIVAEVYHGHGAATTVNNATTGLILAISQLKRPVGRYALMPSFTFAATPAAALWCGLTPYFFDIDPDSWCPDQQVLDELIDRLGEDVAVVVPYATFGTAMPLDYYQGLQQRGIPVVIDAAPGFGTQDGAQGYGEGFPGAVVFSFHATKPFGIGEGGLVYSGNERIITAIRQTANFGFDESRSSVQLGLNGKLAELPAAVGLATLDQFPAKAEERRRVQALYDHFLESKGAFARGFKVQLQRGVGAAQFYSLLVPKDETNQVAVARMAAVGVQARTYFAPSCHQQPHFQMCPRTELVVTEDVSRRIVSLPLWEGMGEEEVKLVVAGLLG